MNMNKDNNKIAVFLSFAAPIVADYIRAIFKLSGFNFKETGQGLEHCFWVEREEKKVQFLLHNLLLEIAAVDRDKAPLQFDERLKDVNYFLAKTARLTESKLKILFQLLNEPDPDKAIARIKEKAGEYERIRILKFDNDKSN